MKLAIIGSRSFNNYDLFYKTLLRFFTDEDGWLFKEVISGGAEGADTLAKEQFENNPCVKYTELKPDFIKYPLNLHGFRAYAERDKQIAATCDIMLAFWDGISPGTKLSLEFAQEFKKPTIIIYI